MTHLSLLLSIALSGPLAGSTAFAQDPPGATQPHETNPKLEPPSNCVSCHDGWTDSPFQAWEGTLMANAMRDPLFLAALTIANQDIPGIGEFCLRCHTPPGWLEGRCQPGDTSALLPDDYEGITCDVCHRMTQAPDGPIIGNAMYTITNGTARTGSFASEYATHDIVIDPFLEAGEMCGVCHEVSNPLFQDFPIERTFSEWASSAYPAEGKTCQSCHFKVQQGYASNDSRVPVRDINLHRMVGGNTFIPRVLAGEFPELNRGEAFEQTARFAEEHLQESAVVTIEPVAMTRGQSNAFTVRVENQTGHKLPSGYPEGRRAWLEVIAKDASGTELLRSGVYDEATQTLDRTEPQLRIYEARLGHDGIYSFHMVEQDEIIFDGRIPPKGFVSRPDLAPIGREFEVLGDGTLANWDLAPYTIEVPATARGPISITARLLYQTTTREYVEFLRDENYTDDFGQQMYDMWATYGMDPPVQMELAVANFDILEPEVPSDDTGEGQEGDRKLCGCASTGGGGAAGFGLVVLSLGRHRRSSRRMA